MVEDATLNDFQPVEDASPAENTESAIDPATITFAYSPGGAKCDTCGAVVEHRWMLEEALVCPSCKEW